MNNEAAHSASPLDFVRGLFPFRLGLILLLAAAAALLLALPQALLPPAPAQAQSPQVILVPNDWALIPEGLLRQGADPPPPPHGTQFRLIFVS